MQNDRKLKLPNPTLADQPDAGTHRLDGASGNWSEKGMVCVGFPANHQPCLRP